MSVFPGRKAHGFGFLGYHVVHIHAREACFWLKRKPKQKTQNQTKTREGRKDCKFSPSHGDGTPYLGCLGTCATGLREYLKETTFPEVCIKVKLESFKVAKNHLSLEGC